MNVLDRDDLRTLSTSECEGGDLYRNAIVHDKTIVIR